MLIRTQQNTNRITTAAGNQIPQVMVPNSTQNKRGDNWINFGSINMGQNTPIATTQTAIVIPGENQLKNPGQQ
jgi:hypothetical protein